MSEAVTSLVTSVIAGLDAGSFDPGDNDGDLGRMTHGRDRLRAQMRLHRDLLDALPVAVYATDTVGNVTYHNRAAVDLVARVPDKANTISPISWTLFRPDGTPLQHGDSPMAIALRERRPVQDGHLLIERPDGTRASVRVLATPLFDTLGALTGAVTVLLDDRSRQSPDEHAQQLHRILEEQVAQRTQVLAETVAKLQDSERTLRLLVDGVMDYSIFMLDPEGCVANWNTGAERIKGYSRAEIVGQHFSRFYTEEARQAGLPQQALETAARCGHFHAEDWRVRKDGTRFWASVAIDAIHDESGALIGFAKITRDLTEHHAMEQKLRQMQKMEAVGQLTSGVAHDFNNLLTVILGNLDLLVRLVPDNDGSRRAAQIARAISAATDGGLRAAALIRRLLGFSRQQALEPEPVDVNQLIRRLTELLGRTLGETIRIHTNLVPNAGFVFVDPNDLENTLLNLSVNARDAMPGGGVLTIETSVVEDSGPIPTQPDMTEREYVLITVTDVGQGMTQETLARVFEPFFTTKEAGRGTGLGLSQVYGFVKQSNGLIAIDSTPGQGTSVRLHLPRLAQAALYPPDIDITAQPAQDDTGSESVLVVEDDDAVRGFTSEALRNLGYPVLEAPNARAALEILDCRPDVRLLFTDVGLPGLMTGWQLSEDVRQRHPDLKVLVTSGYPGTMPRRTGPLDRGIALISKPYSLTELATKVREVLGE